MKLNVSPILSDQHPAILILARGGSKGIPLKNIQIVGGISLLARNILTAKRAGFQDITVSTDHPLIALEALKYKVDIFKRSYVTSTDWAPSIWGVSEFINSRLDVKIVALLQTTSPFMKAKDLYSSFRKLNFPEPFDCIFSVKREHQLRWCHDGLGTAPLNFKYNSRPRRQDWNGEFIETGAFYISRRELILKGYLQNKKFAH
uniref:N-acylneuraminate cytidylyltransferase-like protein n=1 Tax=Heliconius erato TaxID=33431 RepID=L7X0P9_HELEA|nr:N-acylneuraminate cytidylyltransferase-like protein [Heliconius erato]